MFDAGDLHIVWEGLDGGWIHPVDTVYGQGMAGTFLDPQYC